MLWPPQNEPVRYLFILSPDVFQALSVGVQGLYNIIGFLYLCILIYTVYVLRFLNCVIGNMCSLFKLPV